MMFTKDKYTLEEQTVHIMEEGQVFRILTITEQGVFVEIVP